MKESVFLSVLRSFILGSVFVLVFSVLLGENAIWYAMAAAELTTAVLVLWMFFCRSA